MTQDRMRELQADLRYYLGFNHAPGIGPARLDRLLAWFGSLEAAWHAPLRELLAAGLDARSAEALVQTRARLDLEAEYERAQRLGVRLVCRDDPAYPPLLAQISNPPFLLYVRGTLAETDRWALAVVGTRRASTYGKDVTRKLVSELVAAGVTIVSGLALGIDAVAHSAALAAGGRTLAVLGSGVDQLYPQTNAALGEAIMQQGALISEYPLGTLPAAANFPPRNRLISGLALGVLVVEAAPKSGALITTQFAAEQGRDVFAVPGSIFSPRSAGPHALIREGATLVTCAEDILSALNLQAAVAQQELAAVAPATPAEALLLRLIEDEPRHIDEIGRQSGLPQADVAATMALLELKGLVRHVGGMRYVLLREASAAYRVDEPPPAA
ncbi:DNA-processing protein DprA [Kallotenue papyrolyticum]|uniref:DNA-processing protein DprA n=1 Tax=Kallotenue papyrolyticum TaxID=1325125 RepID=UPI0004BAE8A9|nr:DNA-processing protein DprA [Kallotenue papyrolyticum]